MTLKWHPSLTVEKWATHPLEVRVAMVQDEISRARNSRSAGYYGGTQLALERARASSFPGSPGNRAKTTGS